METKSNSTATNIAVLSTLRHRGVPDVPEDVDFLMEHLNDPNFDYQSDIHSTAESGTEIYQLERHKVVDDYSTAASEFDAQSRGSRRYSTPSRTETTSSSFEYDE